MNHTRILDHIRSQIDTEPKLDLRQRRVLKRRLNRRRVQELVLDEVIARGFEEGYIGFETTDDGSPIRADLTAFLDFIKEIMPLIMQWLILFP